VESEFWLHSLLLCLLLHSCKLAEFQLMLSGVSTEISQNSVLPSGYIPRNKDKITKSSTVSSGSLNEQRSSLSLIKNLSYFNESAAAYVFCHTNIGIT